MAKSFPIYFREKEWEDMSMSSIDNSISSLMIQILHWLLPDNDRDIVGLNLQKLKHHFQKTTNTNTDACIHIVPISACQTKTSNSSRRR